jgi:ribonuclease HI
VDAKDLDEVKHLEVLLLQPEVRRDAVTLDRLLHPDFREIGASGRCWTRDEVIDELTKDPEQVPITASALDARQVSDGLILLTYHSEAPHGSALRSSWWARSDAGWQIVFHQGTPVPTGPTDVPDTDRAPT